MYADIAATLSFYCGLRACEIKGLRWQDIDLRNRLLHVRRSKTPAGWRSPTLNATCLDVLQRLHDDAARLGFTEPDHFVFPWHGRGRKLDPTRGMTSWPLPWLRSVDWPGFSLLNRRQDNTSYEWPVETPAVH